jgi:hypothetical protein
MNRSVCVRWLFALVLTGSLAILGCHSGAPSESSPSQACSAASPPAQYILSGGVMHPGPQQLHPGDTVATIVARELPTGPGKPITIVLIRQAPEGKTRQLVQLNADGHLMDPAQDWALRSGDELVFPGGTGSNSTRNPTGPPPRSSY